MEKLKSNADLAKINFEKQLAKQKLRLEREKVKKFRNDSLEI